MMIVIPYKADHLKVLMIQEAQQYMQVYISEADTKALEQGHAYTGFKNGTVLICAGVMPIWKGRGLAWAYVAQQAGRHMVELTKNVKRVLDTLPFNRIEAAVDVDFKPGHRWARLLGFELEVERMRKFRPDGGDSALYARVKQ